MAARTGPGVESSEWVDPTIGRLAGRVAASSAGRVGPAVTRQALRAAASSAVRWTGPAAANSVGPAVRRVRVANPPGLNPVGAAANSPDRPAAGRIARAGRIAARRVGLAAANPAVRPVAVDPTGQDGPVDRMTLDSGRSAAAKPADLAANPVATPPADQPSADPALLRAVDPVPAADPLARWAHPARSLTVVHFSCIRPRVPVVRERL